MTYQDVAWPEAAKLTCLVREAQKDDGRALEALLTTLRPSLVSYFARRLTADIAEDLAQSALLRIVGALPRIDPLRADGYVATVARNLLRTAYRRRIIETRRSADVECLELLDPHESHDRTAEYQELLRAVHRVVDAQLAPELAEIMRALLHGESTAEIALRQGVSPVTVRTRLLRARTILRTELREYARNLGREARATRHRRCSSSGESASCRAGDSEGVTN